MKEEKGWRIKNWSQFQHFKDRCPPWVKLYRTLLDDLYWHELDPKDAKVLVMLWLIASEDQDQEGRLPPLRVLAFRLRMNEAATKLSLKRLNHWVFHDDISAISGRYQDDIPETETETEAETETERKTVTPKGVSDHGAIEELDHESTREVLKRVTKKAQRQWIKTYGDADWIRSEIGKAYAWTLTNPQRAPKGSSYARFLSNWLARGWENYRKYQHQSQTSNKPALKAF